MPTGVRRTVVNPGPTIDPPADSSTQVRLLAERASALARGAALRRTLVDVVDATVGANTDDEHDPEGATIAFERAQVLALLDQAEHRVRECDLALQRLDDGTYGVCTTCGQDIAAGRLDARPAAQTCIACAAGPHR